LLLFGAGCGGDGFAPETAESGLLPGSEGRALQLLRRSTHCGATAPSQLAAFVGPGAEFPAREVSELPPPCPEAPSPRIDVHVEEESVLIDFSAVEAAGVFPRGGFEGYVIYFRRSCPDMALSSASIDEDFSSIVLGSADVQTHFDHLDINLQGVGYDDSSFVKIDLSSVYVNCLRES
ncbi:MAG: hypothetical protein WBM48_19920, partial [Polyangiales bacterium]